MHTIGLVARKGGVGKTTLAIHLAQMAQESGETAVLIDMDRQESACKWRLKRKDQELESVPVIQTTPSKLPATLKELERRGATMVFIDTRPDLDDAAQNTCKLGDFIIIPTGASTMDLEGVQASAKLANQHKTPWGVVFNRIGARDASHREARYLLTGRGARVVENPIIERKAYQRSIGVGAVAWEGSKDANKKAGRELKALWNWLGTQLKGEEN